MGLETFLDVRDCGGWMSQHAKFRAPAERTNGTQPIVPPPCGRNEGSLLSVTSRDTCQPHSVADEGAGPLPGSTVQILLPKECSRGPPPQVAPSPGGVVHHKTAVELDMKQKAWTYVVATHTQTHRNS